MLCTIGVECRAPQGEPVAAIAKGDSMITPAGTPPFPSPIVQPQSSAQSESRTPTVKHAPKSQTVIPSLDLGHPRPNTDALKRPRTASVSAKPYNDDEVSP